MNGTRTVSLTGDDTIVIAGRVLTDLADGDNGDLAYPTEIVAVKTGKNGNSIYALNAMGRQADFKARVIRGSDDDKFLNGLLKDYLSDPASFVLLDGQMTKRTGDGQGNVTYDTYILSGGVITRQPAAKSNVEGDTEQAVVIYEFKFTNAPRGIL